MTVTKAGAITRLSIVCIPTIEQERAIAFYISIGFEKRTDVAFGDSQYRWVEMYVPGETTGIALAPPPGSGEVAPAITGITLSTNDIDAAHAEFKALGVDVDEEVSRMGEPVPPMFWFRDPTGHTLMVVEQPD